MNNENSKESLQVIGAILIVVAVLAFIYTQNVDLYFGISYPTTPYRTYALPLGALGMISIIASYFTNNNSALNIQVEKKKENEVYCGYCGRPIPMDNQFCPNCGKEQSKFTTRANI